MGTRRSGSVPQMIMLELGLSRGAPLDATVEEEASSLLPVLAWPHPNFGGWEA